MHIGLLRHACLHALCQHYVSFCDFHTLPLAKSFQEHTERNGAAGAPATTSAGEGQVAPVGR